MYWKKKPQVNNSVEDWRKKRGFTQAQLARKSEVTRQTIIALEKGDYIPSVALALKLAKVLKTTVQKLFTLKEDS